METAILSATAALTGSLIGGVSTLIASWLTQRGQLRTQALMREATKRETLYTEFIIEASKCRADAWSHQAETPEVLATLYSAVERMRLTSSDEVRRLAEKVVLHVIEAYAAPDRSFDELRRHLDRVTGSDPLKDFSEACRHELIAMQDAKRWILRSFGREAAIESSEI
jgi:hypothetical protein